MLGLARRLPAPFCPRDVLGEEGPDVHPHAVVNVGVPADGLFGERLPADEDVVRWLAFEDELETALQLFSGLKAGIAAGFAGFHGGLLAANPITEVGVGELLQIGVGELVIVHQRAEPALVAVPDVPDEGTVVEDCAMLLEEFVTQPLLQCCGFTAPRAGAGNQCTEVEFAQEPGPRARRRSAAGASPFVAEKQTMPSLSANFSRPSWSSAGQSGKLEPVWRGH